MTERDGFFLLLGVLIGWPIGYRIAVAYGHAVIRELQNRGRLGRP